MTADHKAWQIANRQLDRANRLEKENKQLKSTAERLIHALEVAERKLDKLRVVAQPCTRATATYEERERLVDVLESHLHVPATAWHKPSDPHPSDGQDDDYHGPFILR